MLDLKKMHILFLPQYVIRGLINPAGTNVRYKNYETFLRILDYKGRVYSYKGFLKEHKRASYVRLDDGRWIYIDDNGSKWDMDNTIPDIGQMEELYQFWFVAKG